MRYTFILGLFIFVSTTSTAQLSMEQNNDGIFVKENNEPVLFYHTTSKSHHGAYERTNYIHPLWNVDGVLLTEDFPEDHLHQRGVFWAWHQIWIDGKRIGDGWSLEDYDQEVVDTDWQTNSGGTGTLSAEVYWKSDLYKPDGVVVPYIRENTAITIHPEQKNYRRIDFEIRLTALDEPVSIGGSEDDKGYSGFSIRIKLPDDVRFKGPDGSIVPKNNAIESPGYVDIAATFDEDHSGGVMIIDHPENPGYPHSWILRERTSMQNVRYPGRKPVVITSTDPLLLKYSLVTYAGSIQGREIEKLVKSVQKE